ncbi:hypothetical protein [Morganella sp. EGD-HP17]|uniref:hypothetical protein n=1 Tax=Morganella sp. EGD-HP17 TaxID=1435146 RepID=UPI0003FED569|nr:hypothetical protein [Morganella sp. EGD-HP17]ETO41215.1 hypothetical protein X965_11245 [Morganella sp. EGD-HP17]
MISTDAILTIYAFLLVACLPLWVFYTLSSALRRRSEYKKLKRDSEKVDLPEDLEEAFSPGAKKGD